MPAGPAELNLITFISG